MCASNVLALTESRAHTFCAIAFRRCSSLSLRQKFLVATIAYAERELQRERLSAGDAAVSGNAASTGDLLENRARGAERLKGSASAASLQAFGGGAQARSALMTERAFLLTHAQRELKESLDRSAELVFAARPSMVAAAVFVTDPQCRAIPDLVFGRLQAGSSAVSIAHSRIVSAPRTVQHGEEVEVVWQLCDTDGEDVPQSEWVWQALLQAQPDAGDAAEPADDLMIPAENITCVLSERRAVFVHVFLFVLVLRFRIETPRFDLTLDWFW